MKLVLLSDTHGHHRSVSVPNGDVLIHCGDATTDAGRASLRDFLVWLEALPHPRKLFCAGNHDWAYEKWPDLALAAVKEYAPSATYLQDSGCEIDGFKFWGSPVQPEFCNWAFNRKRGPEIKRHWDMIPDDTDVLITHGPPAGHHGLDISGFDKSRCGCRDLYEAVMRVNPDVHAFGHIHHSYGTHKMIHDDGTWTHLFNASICDEAYKPTRHPWVFELC
jgi:predicted phosphodiesterase